MTVNIGDIMVLSNGLKLKLVPQEDNENYFETIDVDSGKPVTNGIHLRRLNDLSIGSLTWGYGSDEYEIVEIIKDTYIHKQHPKPPLGVMPKDIYEFHRVIELCRALYEYSNNEGIGVNYELLIKWSDELNDRLYGLKGDIN